MTDTPTPMPEDVKEALARHQQALTLANSLTSEALKNVASSLYKRNIAVVTEAGDAAVFKAASAHREQEEVAEKVIGKEVEAWMEFFAEFGLPPEDSVPPSASTLPSDWRAPMPTTGQG